MWLLVFELVIISMSTPNISAKAAISKWVPQFDGIRILCKYFSQVSVPERYDERWILFPESSSCMIMS